MQTQPTPATALADWSMRLRNRASGMLRIEDVRKLSDALATAIDRARPGQPPIDASLVAHWLQGHCAPETPELHAAVLEALGLHNDSKRYANGTGDRMMQMRWDMSVLYAMIDQRFKTIHVDEVLPACDKPRPRIRIGNATALCEANETLKASGNGHGYRNGNGSGIHSLRTSHYADRHGLPPRLKPNNVTYPELDRGELETLMGDSPEGTRNAHEFLCAFMARHRLSDYAFAEDAKCSNSHINLIRNGSRLPGPDYLPQFRTAMNKYDPKAFARFEALIIANRLHMVIDTIAQEKADPEHLIHHRYAREVTFELGELPQHYWSESMARCNHPRSKKVHGTLPDWVMDILPLKTKGDYLRAVRFTLGLGANEASAAARVHANHFCDVEHYGNPEDASARERLASFYQQRDAERMEALKAEGKPAEPFFVPAVYNRLPNNVRGPYKKHAAGESATHEGTVAPGPEQGRRTGA